MIAKKETPKSKQFYEYTKKLNQWWS